MRLDGDAPDGNAAVSCDCMSSARNAPAGTRQSRQTASRQTPCRGPLTAALDNMKNLIVIILVLSSLLSGSVTAGEDCATEQCKEARKIPALPADVALFVDLRDGCDHFRGEPWDSGEEPAIKERREFIFQNIKELCTRTDKQLEELRNKYRNNPMIFDLLGKYEDILKKDDSQTLSLRSFPYR